MNHTLSQWLATSAIMLAGLFAPGSSFAAPEEKGAEKVFVGYLFGQPANINFRLYTHICHAFLPLQEAARKKWDEGGPAGK